MGARLDGLVSPTLFVLHDRRIPRSRANIDHLVVTRGGVWVLDTKRYKGRPELKVEGGLLRPRVEKLLVARRDKTGLVDGVLRQMDAVSAVLGDVPLRGALCFVDADFPALGGAFVTRGVHVVWPRRLAKLVTRDDHGEVDVRVTAERLAQTFRPA